MPFAAAALGASLASGCEGGTGPSGGQLTVSAAATPRGTGTDSIALGAHTLVFDQVQLVLREIELERVFHDDCDDDDRDDGDEGRGDDDCEELEIGPILVDLPLDGGAERVITVEADSGSYDEVEFEIHKPDDDDDRDEAFLAAHPDFRRVSIRVRARYDGEPVVFETDLNAEQERRLVPPLTLTERAATNLTLTADLATWFVVGGQLVNPVRGLKGASLENEIKDNIKRSIEMVKDHDRDGRDDDHDDD
jgi:hypothetical protein